MIWELIRQNKRKSFILFISMGLVLFILGYLVGNFIDPVKGGITGIFVAGVIWMIMSFVSYFAGDSILLAVSQAKPITHDVYPQIFNIVEEMKIAANLPAMPRIYLIPDSAPNAFATGRNPQKSAIAVTGGLLARLNRDELQGVIAHEMSHILNRDILYMTFSGVILGMIVLISEVFLRGLFYTRGGGKFRSSRKGGGQAQALMMVLAIIFAIIAPLVARILYFSISRKREYLADATAVRLTRYPEGLASALEKISADANQLVLVNKVTAPMYIINPLEGRRASLTGLFSTHPPIRDRIKILRQISGSANYDSYQKAYVLTLKKGNKIIQSVSKRDNQVIPIRPPMPGENPVESAKTIHRNIGDMIKAADQFAFITCACGLRLKFPPDFSKKTIACPRCQRQHEVPVAEIAFINTVAAELFAEKNKIPEKGVNMQANEQPLHYQRKTTGWESFFCQCGRLQQLSPSFVGKQVICPHCHRYINISSA